MCAIPNTKAWYRTTNAVISEEDAIIKDMRRMARVGAFALTAAPTDANATSSLWPSGYLTGSRVRIDGRNGIAEAFGPGSLTLQHDLAYYIRLQSHRGHHKGTTMSIDNCLELDEPNTKTAADDFKTWQKEKEERSDEESDQSSTESPVTGTEEEEEESTSQTEERTEGQYKGDAHRRINRLINEVRQVEPQMRMESKGADWIRTLTSDGYPVEWKMISGRLTSTKLKQNKYNLRNITDIAPLLMTPPPERRIMR